MTLQHHSELGIRTSRTVFGSEGQSTVFAYVHFPSNRSCHIRIALQQLCYARGYIPHGQNPNISLNHIWKYSREERALCAESSEKLTGEQFHTYFI